MALGSWAPEGNLPDQIAIRLPGRQVHVALEAPADRGAGRAGDRIERLSLVILPIDPDAPRLPAGQAVEVEAGLDGQELALRLHREPRQRPVRLLGASPLPPQGPVAMGAQGIAPRVL